MRTCSDGVKPVSINASTREDHTGSWGSGGGANDDASVTSVISVRGAGLTPTYLLDQTVILTILLHPWAEGVTRFIFKLFMRVQKILVADPAFYLYRPWRTSMTDSVHMEPFIHLWSVSLPVDFRKPPDGTAPGVILARRGIDVNPLDSVSADAHFLPSFSRLILGLAFLSCFPAHWTCTDEDASVTSVISVQDAGLTHLLDQTVILTILLRPGAEAVTTFIFRLFMRVQKDICCRPSALRLPSMTDFDDWQHPHGTLHPSIKCVCVCESYWWITEGFQKGDSRCYLITGSFG